MAGGGEPAPRECRLGVAVCPPPSIARSCALVRCRLGQPVQPHEAEPQPVGGRGAGGPAAAGGAGQDHPHVPLEGRHRAGLAGGGHGHAHVRQGLCGETDEQEENNL